MEGNMRENSPGIHIIAVKYFADRMMAKFYFN